MSATVTCAAPDKFPSWDDCQEDDRILWAACWSPQRGGADVCPLDDYLRRSFEDWLDGRDGGWLLLGIFPTRESASYFLLALDKFSPRRKSP